MTTNDEPDEGIEIITDNAKHKYEVNSEEREKTEKIVCLLGSARVGIRSTSTPILQEITTIAAKVRADLIAITEVGLAENAH